MTFRAYADLLRLHFAFAWPLLFCSGLFLAFGTYGGFSWPLVVTAALIGLFGFEAGMVLNDYVDRERDQRDVEGRLTRYWRPFGTRPLAVGEVPSRHALALFLLLALAALALITTLPFPHSLFVAGVMAYSYAVEVFYQVKKRDQSFPVAQVVGRTDFALFPVAGYLAAGMPDLTALLYFLFFYPYALAHLGANDLVDVRNDLARGMRTITVLYGVGGTVLWIAGFTALHGGPSSSPGCSGPWRGSGFSSVFCCLSSQPRSFSGTERPRRRCGCSPSFIWRWWCTPRGWSSGRCGDFRGVGLLRGYVGASTSFSLTVGPPVSGHAAAMCGSTLATRTGTTAQAPTQTLMILSAFQHVFSTCRNRKTGRNCLEIDSISPEDFERTMIGW